MCVSVYLFQSMFSQATFKGWMDIMYAAVDNRGVSFENVYALKLCQRSQESNIGHALWVVH